MLLRNAHILVVDDDVHVLTAMRLLLKGTVKSISVEKNPNTIPSLLQDRQFDAILLDMNFNGLVNTGNEGIFWLNRIKELQPRASVILITAYGDIDLAIRSLKEGAVDFVVKPWKNDKLIESLRSAVEKKKGTAAAIMPKGTSIIGESKAIGEILTRLKKVAPTDANILILGENGTGKDLIAKAIHESSARKDKPFVKVDVGALSESLFESELFGYKKGAFTDARENRKGRFEAANGGTIFLDEIGNITLAQQARLLTVLQNRHITPLGANEPVAIDIRLICATNLELTALADETRFRKDLIYRINTVDITVPPLREREDDVLPLASYYLKVYSDKYEKDGPTMDRSFLKKLKSHPFPGNVRELQYIMERSVIMAEGNVLSAEDIVFSPIERYAELPSNEEKTLETIEKNTILEVINRNRGNISKSAEELGISRAALYRRLEKYGL